MRSTACEVTSRNGVASCGQRKGTLRTNCFATLSLCLTRLSADPSCRLFFLTAQASYDLVILNGRVIDPESRTDAIRNLGISNGKIKTIAPINSTAAP